MIRKLIVSALGALIICALLAALWRTREYQESVRKTQLREAHRLLQSHSHEDNLRGLESAAYWRPDDKELAIIANLMDSENSAVRIRAIRTIGAFGTSDHRQQLTTQLGDSDPAVRQYASEAIQQLDRRYSKQRREQ
jgi:HEAT repeat protein